MNPDKYDNVTDAALLHWEFEDFWNDDDRTGFCAGAEGYLGGGESEEEFVQRLSEEIWKANGAFCRVEIRATYLEELPYEIYELDEDDYKRTMGIDDGDL